MSDQFPSNHSIIDCLSTHYGITGVNLVSLSVGADIDSSLFRADTYKLSYFIKIKQGNHFAVNAAILDLLSDAGVRQIILPIKSHAGQSFHHIDGFTIIVYPFINGQDGFAHELTDEQWVAFGRVLKHIHQIDVSHSIRSLIRREDYSPKWRESVRSLLNHVESDPHYKDDLSSHFANHMKQNASVIHRLVDCAEQLTNDIKARSPDFVLCHSDCHAGNILISDNGAIYIVDWDDPIMAPKERDLMFIGAGVGNAWNNPHEAELFYRGYGEVVINIPLLAYYRCERIVEDIAIYGQQFLLGSLDSGDRVKSYQHYIAQFEPRGVVDIALQTV